jgi:hypothetical protein
LILKGSMMVRGGMLGTFPASTNTAESELMSVIQVTGGKT